jgi:transforming growth factor-beta-induced protein
MFSRAISRIAPIVVLGVIAPAITGCDDKTELAAPASNIVQLAQATPDLSTLVSAITAANLATTLSGVGPFTVFAPVNSAFAALPADQRSALLLSANQSILQKTLTYHVVPGRILASDLTEGRTLTTVEGTTIRVTLAGGAKVNNARVITADIQASNGVVHLIDAVLLESLDIVDVATIRGFSSLVSAAQTAGLVSALRGNGSGSGLTVFAPTNAAFTALGALPSNPTLAQVLQFHVVAGRALASSLTNNQQLTTLQGGSLTVLLNPVRIRGGTKTVNVVATDVPAKNGVIHVIDGVLVP